MKQTDLTALMRVADAVYQHESRAMAELAREEQAIRGALSAVNAASDGLKTAQIEETGRMVMTGAELAWRAWAGKRKTALNTELARVLVRKSQDMARVRAAFGRREALRLLDAQAKRPSDAFSE